MLKLITFYRERYHGLQSLPNPGLRVEFARRADSSPIYRLSLRAQSHPKHISSSDLSEEAVDGRERCNSKLSLGAQEIHFVKINIFA